MFYDRYSESIPVITSPGENKAMGRWTGSSYHKRTLNFVRDIWRCLILCMYGKKITFGSINDWRQVVLLLANVWFYAEHMIVTNDVLDCIRTALMDLPDLWKHVSEDPLLFFHLAYVMKAPELYLDATRHVVAMSYPKPLMKTLDRGDDATPCDEHQLALLMAARMNYDEAVQDVREVLFERLPKYPHTPAQGSSFDPYEHARSIFQTELFDMMHDFSKPVKIFGKEFETGFYALRWLLNLTNTFGLKGVIRPLNLYQNTPTSLPYWYQLTFERAINQILEGYVSALESNMLFCTTHTKRGTAIFDGHGDCHCAQHQHKNRHAAVNFAALFRGRELRPWPLDLEDSREVKKASDPAYVVATGRKALLEAFAAAFAEPLKDQATTNNTNETQGEILTKPITIGYLKTIGLEKTFEQYIREREGHVWRQISVDKWGWTPDEFEGRFDNSWDSYDDECPCKTGTTAFWGLPRSGTGDTVDVPWSDTVVGSGW